MELTPETYELDKTDELGVNDTSVSISYGGKSLILQIQVSAKPVPEPVKHTVTFTGEGVTNSTVQVNDGDKVSAPQSPKREGYTFKYWAKQGETTAYDFNTAVTDDLTLVAVWEQVNGNTEQTTNVGLVVGLSVGGAVVLAGVAVLVVLLLRKKKLAAVNSSTVVEEQTDDKTNKAE